MIAVLAALSVLALSAQAPQGVDELRAMARAGSDSVLVERTRRRPDDAREALRRLLADASGGGDSAGVAALTAAERLAGGFAVAWRDSFLLRQVGRFRSMPRADQQATVAADSVRREGDAARDSAGIGAAMLAWRESLRRFELLGDTAGVAAALWDVGSGFFLAREEDSAEVYLSRSLDLAERIGDHRVAANALARLGHVSDTRGDLQRASELYARAGELRERTGDARGRATDQNSLAIIAAQQGDLAGARRAFEAALAANRSAGYGEAAAGVLLNLAHLATIEGDLSEAAADHREALSIYRASGNRLYMAAALRDLGTVALSRGDYPGAVTALSEAAGILGRIGSGPEINEVDVRMRLSRARAAMGDLQGARTELKVAEALASRRSGGGGGVSLAALAWARGELAQEFNQFAEAERQYARALRLPQGGGPADEWVRPAAQFGMGLVLFRRQSYHRAQIALERLLANSVDSPNAAATRLMIGQAAWRRGDAATARRVIGQALDTLHKLGAPALEAEALGTLGDLEAGAGRALTAESLYQRGLTRLGARPAPRIAWQLHAGLAGALRSRGALADAVGELSAAIMEIERVSGSLALEEQRAAFRADKWDVYVALALLERERGRTEAAFEASERLRERQMLDLLAQGRVAQNSAGRELASREQDLRRRMADLTQQLEGSAVGEHGLRDAPPGDEAAGPAREALARAQEAYGEMLLEMREANPSYAALVRGEIATARELRAVLAPDEALLEYLVGDSTTIVFVVTRDTVAALDLKLTHNVLAAEVDFARVTLATGTRGGVRRDWRPPLRRLYRQLIEPVAASGLLTGKRQLIIAPHAELHYLPFAALVRPDQPEQLLIERYLIQYVPSASVWLRLRDRPEPARGGGILALAPRAKALPGSRREVAAIRRIYGDRARTLVGTSATERAFRTLAPAQEIVHLATYGVLNKHNPLFSYVEMGGGSGEDGRLEVHEVFGLTLNARLLVLSACQTGLAAGALADVPPGDDWVGLVQGFLYAGASNVLATLWPVADVATARLMDRFYRELASGRSEAEALAVAQRAAVRDPAMAHPFFWAGFTMVRGR